MSIIKDSKLTEELMLRVYNNNQATEELRIEDEKGIKELCNRIWGDGSVEPSIHDIHSFNNIVTKVATTVSDPDVQQLLKFFCEVQNVAPNTQLVEYKRQVKKHIKFKLSAVGSAVSLKKIEGSAKHYIELGHIQTGIVYDTLSLQTSAVENFRILVADVAAARVQMVYETIMNLIKTGAQSGGIILESQKLSKANITVGEMDKIANTLGRRTGSKPLLVADRSLINSFAAKKVTAVASNMPESLKSQFYNYEITNLGSCEGVVMKNDFTTLDGDETQFPINTGYMVSSANGTTKPFMCALAGGLTQKTEEDIEHGRIKMFIRQRIGIDFLAYQNIGVITDTSVTSL